MMNMGPPQKGEKKRPQGMQSQNDEAEDPQEHMIEEGTPLAWAHRVAEEEAAGLD